MPTQNRLTYTRIKLKPKGAFHFGKRGIGLNNTETAMPADTLFSALCIAIDALYGSNAVNELIARFPRTTNMQAINHNTTAPAAVMAGGTLTNNPPFRITSLMPYVDNLFLLPMPRLQPQLSKQSGIAGRKTLKQINWLSEQVFTALLQGKSIANQGMLVNLTNPDNPIPYTVQHGAIWVSQAEQIKLGGDEEAIWKVTTRPRVTIDRESGAAAAYSSGAIHYQTGAGLYALMQWDQPDELWVRRIEAAFTYLGDSGIGGERSYGYGQFTPTFEHNITVPAFMTDNNPAYFTTLSPYLPQPTEWTVFSAAARYAITLRRGWLSMAGYTNLRRPTVRMIETGAILAWPEHGVPIGQLADATPQKLLDESSPYHVYRYGLAWPVPVAAAALRSSAGNSPETNEEVPNVKT